MMSKFELLQERLQKAFPKFIKVFCIEQRNIFYLMENKTNGTTIILDNEIDFDNSKTFMIRNTVSIGFIPIDGSNGLLDYGESHCDFIVFNKNDFCFVELKMNVSSPEERAIRKNRKKGVKQLKNTIALLDHKLNCNYESLNLEAYISTPTIYPRFNASWREIAQDFLESQGIPLYEQNEKVFN